MSETNGTEAQRAAAEHQRVLDEQTAADRLDAQGAPPPEPVHQPAHAPILDATPHADGHEPGHQPDYETEHEHVSLHEGNGGAGGSYAAPVHEPAPRPIGSPGDHEPTPVETEMANTSAAKMSGKEAHAKLREKGITIARVTPPDLFGIDAKRKDEADASVMQPSHRPRQFPNLVVDELVAVDRFGDVHRLDPDRPDAIAFHKQMEDAEPLPSVTQAHAEYEAIYKPTDAGRRRAEVRKSLVGIKEAMAGAGRNVVQMASDAVAALAGLVHDQMPDDEPEDCLRAALRALAGGRTVDAMTEMQKADELLIHEDWLPELPDGEPRPRNPLLDDIIDAEEALAAGDRPACMKLLHEIIGKLKPTKHRVVIEDPKAPLPPL